MRPLNTERDQCRTDDLLKPTIKLLDQDIQRLIHQESQGQCRTLLEFSDCTTNPKRYWSLLRKLGGKRSSPPPNISIAFEGKPHSSSNAIAQAFNRQLGGALRRLMRGSPPPPPCGHLIQAVRRKRHHSGHKEGGLFHRPEA